VLLLLPLPKPSSPLHAFLVLCPCSCQHKTLPHFSLFPQLPLPDLACLVAQQLLV
jgi:hypothetical protein